MDSTQVQADLRKRAVDSKHWIEQQPEPIKDIRFKKRLWTATPEEFLDDAKRKERNGVGFRFSLDSDEKEISIFIKVRIKPGEDIGPKGDSPSYVAIYVVNQVTGADELLSYQHLDIPSTYSDLISLGMGDWYRKWIIAALRSNNKNKVLRKETRMT